MRYPDAALRLNRREFIHLSGLAGAAVLLAACGDNGGSGATSEAVKKVRIAYTSGTFPSIVNGKAGPLDFGAQFGLQISPGDVQTFDSHATATQAVLAGEADVIAGSFPSTLSLIASGEPFKAFAPFSNGNDLLEIGRDDVDSIDKVLDPQVRIGIDSPGGLVHFVTNVLLAANGISEDVASLNTLIVEDTPQQVGAFVNNDIQAVLINRTPSLEEIQAEMGEENVHILASLWEDVKEGVVLEAFAAPEEWIESNLETANALTMAILTGNRELARDYGVYKDAVAKYVEGGEIDDSLLMPLWELAREFEFWPYNGDLEEASIEFTAKASQQSGTLEGSIDVSSVVDRRPMDAAMAEIGEVSVQEIIG